MSATRVGGVPSPDFVEIHAYARLGTVGEVCKGRGGHFVWAVAALSLIGGRSTWGVAGERAHARMLSSAHLSEVCDTI